LTTAPVQIFIRQGLQMKTSRLFAGPVLLVRLFHLA
jgi:hypothetical protein